MKTAERAALCDNKNQAFRTSCYGRHNENTARRAGGLRGRCGGKEEEKKKKTLRFLTKPRATLNNSNNDIYLLSSFTDTTSPPSNEEKKEMEKLCNWYTATSMGVLPNISALMLSTRLVWITLLATFATVCFTSAGISGCVSSVVSMHSLGLAGRLTDVLCRGCFF